MNGQITIHVSFDLNDSSCKSESDFEHEADKIADNVRRTLLGYFSVLSPEVYVTDCEVTSSPCKRCGEYRDEYDLHQIDEYFGEVFCETCCDVWSSTLEKETTRHTELAVEDAKESFEQEGEW